MPKRAQPPLPCQAPTFGQSTAGTGTAHSSSALRMKYILFKWKWQGKGDKKIKYEDKRLLKQSWNTGVFVNATSHQNKLRAEIIPSLLSPPHKGWLLFWNEASNSTDNKPRAWLLSAKLLGLLLEVTSTYNKTTKSSVRDLAEKEFDRYP